MQTGISKPKRKVIPTQDRTDNNFDKILKGVGHVRTKNHSRCMHYKMELMVYYLEQLRFPDQASEVGKAYHIVYEKLKNLLSLGNVKRSSYNQEFKWALKILVSAFEVEALPIGGFATLENLPTGTAGVGVDFSAFMRGLEDGSVTTESTATWSDSAVDSVLAEFGLDP